MPSPKDVQTLDRLFERYKYDVNVVIRSKDWFDKQTQILSKKRINEGLLFSQEKVVSRITPSKMYFFRYAAKHADTLPYWDKFPLVLPYHAGPDFIMGLNLHYLSPYYRVQLLTRLMKFATNSKLNEDTRIKYSWQLISGVSKFAIAKPCIKKYLLTHIRSQFVEIKPPDWHSAIFLPVARFEGAHDAHVWTESMKIAKW